MPAEPRELHPFQSFDQSFRSRGPGDFRPEVVEVAGVDAMTEDGYGGPPPPRATHLPTHPSIAPVEPLGPDLPVPSDGGAKDGHPAPAETPQDPAGFDASAPNEAVLVSLHPEFSLETDAADLAELL